MRLGIVLFSLLFVVALAAPSHAQFGTISVATEWVVDPNVGGGGYVSVNVVNNGAEPVYVVCIEDPADINVIYTGPGIGPYWYQWITTRWDWEVDDSGLRTYPWFRAPDTSESPWLWDEHFYSWQVLIWQVRYEENAIQPGEPVPTEFRYLLGEGAKSSARAVYGPLNYMVMGVDGEILGSGQTSITGVVPTEGASFGQVKALYAR